MATSEVSISPGEGQSRTTTSQSILARITTDKLLELYGHHDVHEIAGLLGPTLDAIETNRLKKAIWARLKKHPRYSARPSGEAIRRRKIGVLRTNYIPMRRNGKSPVDRWETVRLRVVENKTTREICHLQECSHPSVFVPLQKLGLTSGAGVTPCFSFGQVFDRASIRSLYNVSGLKTITSFAQETAVPFAVIEPFLAPRNPDHEVSLGTARKVAGWRHQLFAYLMSNAGRTGDFPGQNRVLHTFFPDLTERYGFLREMLAQIGREHSTWTPQKLKIYLLEQAARGKKAARQFLPWSVELMPFLEKNLEQLRGPHYQRLAYQLIAEWLGTTLPTIASVAHHACKAISPDEMRWLVLNRRATAPSVIVAIRPKGKPGRKREDEHSKTYWLIGEQVEKEIPGHLKNDKLAIMTARRRISEKSKGQYSYDLVAQYHKEFRLNRSKKAPV